MTNTYIVACDKTKEAMIIDPSEFQVLLGLRMRLEGVV